MGKRITWSNPDGSWGIKGVDLSELPPRAYAALCKLKKVEDLIATIQNPESPDDVVQQASDEFWGLQDG